MAAIDLSVIIPTFNEALCLPLLLGDLDKQKKIVLELIVVDGGSQDETALLAQNFLKQSGISGRVLITEKGRGRQLNLGASKAKADWLLFLHADSRLAQNDQIQQSLEFIRSHYKSGPKQTLAGRFALRFDSSVADRSRGFYYLEAKARLNRKGCIHGDQGYLVRYEDFLACGRFREDLPVMEDTCFADKFGEYGRWLVLPGEIITSPRRFIKEGLGQRQTMNALLMNFLAIDWNEFFSYAKEVYQVHDNSKKFDLPSLFLMTQRLLKNLPTAKRIRLWVATGRYVTSQIWQIGFFLDCSNNFKAGLPAGKGSQPWLQRFDKWFVPLTNHRAGSLLTAAIVRVWFAWECFMAESSSEKEG